MPEMMKFDDVDVSIQAYFLALEKSQDADTARKLCKALFAMCHVYVDGPEVIRAIEARLPMPSPAQAEYVSMHDFEGEVILARAVGAFGDTVIYAHPQVRLLPSGHTTVSMNFDTVKCPADKSSTVPEWDFLRPMVRRPFGREVEA